MGNCMETCIVMEEGEEEIVKKQREGEEGMSDGIGSVKVVLTKEELKWLILELNSSDGRRGGLKLEQVLQQIHRARQQQQQQPWKPSLESILEAPEILEFER
ncbi:hypothetical protein PIB30_001832 [Stylosanthes scabra]|uniref:Uncharacterized protein n=1 Tax=Stylosanthes scabra TaxID=79078 RepID=A0ABU6W4G9_9FABA|nr:hypothetical protein [Stylosanthes scabra]